MATGESIQFDTWQDQGPRAGFRAEEMMRESFRSYGSPGAIFGMIAADIPDDQLVNFMELAESINNITYRYNNTQHQEVTWYSPHKSDFTRAEAAADGTYRVPIADRSTLQDFFFQDDVIEALETYYWQEIANENDPVIEVKEFDDQEYPIAQSAVESHPSTVEPLDPTTSLHLVNEYYWSEDGQKKYVTPADTLKDIAADLPSEQVIPLILAIQDRFPRLIDPEDGTYELVVSANYLAERTVKDGIIWETYSERVLRSYLEYACDADLAELNFFNRFDGEQFNEEYYEMLTDQNEDREEGSGELALNTFLVEQRRRHKERYGY